MDNCLCHIPDYNYREYPITDDVKINNSSIQIPTFNGINIEELKNKVICEYGGIIQQLECGIQPDLEFLLEEISLIEMNTNIQNTIFSNSYSEISSDKYLLKQNYLSEFKGDSDKVLENLGIDKHIIIDKNEYDKLDKYEKDVIYLITE